MQIIAELLVVEKADTSRTGTAAQRTTPTVIALTMIARIMVLLVVVLSWRLWTAFQAGIISVT